MALSRREIQKKSDDKRGVRSKAYHLPEATIALIDRLADARGISKSALLTEMAHDYAEKHGIAHEYPPTTA